MKKITNESLFELKSVTQPKVAGDNIFYIETSINKEENRYDGRICSVNMATKKITEWGTNDYENHSMDISPDKKTLSFISSKSDNEKPQIFIMSIAGGRAEQVTTEEEGVSSYSWRSDSQEMYYQIAKKNKKDDEEDKKEAKKLPEPSIITKTMYKLDGQGVMPTDLTYYYKRINLQSKEVTELYQSDKGFSVGYVAKDESYLIITKEVDSEKNWTFGRGEVYLIDLQTKEMTLLTKSLPHGSFFFAKMSPDEDTLLLIGNEFEYDFVSQNKLYTYNMKTQELVCFTKDLDIEIGDLIVADFQQNMTGAQIEWLNSQEFYFPATVEGKIVLYVGNVNGTITKAIDKKWHLTGTELINQTRLAITYSTPSKPSELAIYDLVTQDYVVLYNPNSEFEKEHTIVEPVNFHFKGYDNWDIEAWYLPPVDGSDKHPAVLNIHGGPQVCYGHSFFHEMQMLAAKGYGVMMMNPRGGNSYGQEFVASILGDYGNHDFDDLMIGVDEFLKRFPSIDEEHVYVTGGSYGGFMTNWVVGHTDRFKAAVTQRSISNWISFYGTSDVGAFFVEYQLQHDLSDFNDLWRMSPLAYASNATTPLLLLHGQSDLRCPLEQAEQFYTAMKKNNVDTKLITFPQSTHGLSRIGLPNLRIKRLEAITDWFSAHK
ncbi:Dipeptidyl aminopeptidase/acylaminoacyl peptidase [Granulicatella balaenopterae]|uniref:Dipeptidyl aminopeptidase/acylaminoacyl peptidase n=1 Tax=Granulicatella balaenopterae TaxID=137733 RepID=A0A1H9L9R6_9LACT|nr:S9 family peptidase [Granulicatella balaenopterae]SER07969.1 Dipeptidyl aminopeptidase/acylaminoacyl peptidase [Granulicatella balaenopterae]